MGTWDTTIFGNDTACDWADSLEDVDDLSVIKETIRQVLDVGTDYLEAPDAEEGLAAAETIAGLLGLWGVQNSYTEPVEAWVRQTRLIPPKALIQRACQVIDRVLTEPSELLELWEDAGEVELAEWKANVEDLKLRLLSSETG